MAEALVPVSGPLDVRRTLHPLRHGPRDPAFQVAGPEVWRAVRTPAGPATVRLVPGEGRVRATAWGAGAEVALGAVAGWLGQADDPGAFRPGHPVVADLARRLAGLRLTRTAAVVEALVPTVLAQKVTSLEAVRSWSALVRTWGEAAPGPGADRGLRVPPSAARLAATPSWAFHPLGVERRRAECIVRACRVAERLEEATTLPPAAAAARLLALPGIGPWTWAKVALVAWGDADAVCTGDYHLPDQVAWALAREPRAGDDRMLALLAPFAGHRARVQRLIVAGGIRAPRYGPRLAPRAIAGI